MTNEELRDEQTDLRVLMQEYIANGDEVPASLSERLIEISRELED